MSLKLNFIIESGDFEGFTPYEGGNYKITVLDFDIDDLAIVTDLADNVCNWLSKNLESVKRVTATKLIKLKNDDWLEENEPTVSENEFEKAIGLENVLIFSDGIFEVFFNDNDLFWGHAIKVDIDDHFNISGVALCG